MTASASTSATIADDRIFLRGLRVDCIIGFIDWERQMPQTVVLELEFPCDCAHAAIRDDVADTIDYKTIAKRTLAFVQASQYHLVETLAQQLAMLLLGEFGLRWVRITVNKPGAIRYSSDVGVSIQRTRQQWQAWQRERAPAQGDGARAAE